MLVTLHNVTSRDKISPILGCRAPLGAITSLQKKGKKYEWNKKCEESFEKLKALVTTTPILRIVDPNKDFVVCTDACNDGLGGVLTQ